MGAGKTTIGKLLAKQQSWEFFDIDMLIEFQQQQKISEIFRLQGEESFRNMETAWLNSFHQNISKDQVIATGGGIILRPENCQLLRKIGTVIYLQASIESVLYRLLQDLTRPLLQGSHQDKRENVEKLIKMREPIYLETADILVDTDHKSPSIIVEEILTKLGKK